MRQFKISLAIILTCAISACKKDNELSARTQLLIDKKWQLQALIQSYPGSPDFDFFAHTDACSKDDYRQFEVPHTTRYDEGPTKCRAKDEQTQVGYWEFNNGDKELSINDPLSNDKFTILELSDKVLKMQRVLPQSTGLDLTQTFTYGVIQ